VGLALVVDQILHLRLKLRLVRWRRREGQRARHVAGGTIGTTVDGGGGDLPVVLPLQTVDRENLRGKPGAAQVWMSSRGLPRTLRDELRARGGHHDGQRQTGEEAMCRR